MSIVLGPDLVNFLRNKDSVLSINLLNGREKKRLRRKNGGTVDYLNG